jgi:zinc transport system substrate-binding protein
LLITKLYILNNTLHEIMDMKVILGIAAAVAVAAAIIAMSSQSQQGPATSAEDDRIKVAASFFPLYDFARNVGGDRAQVYTMVPAGIEPHDWEPTPRSIGEAESADLIVYNGAGFENWIGELDARKAVDTSSGIELLSGFDQEESEGAGPGVSFDPHIWLDPVLAIRQVEAIRDGFVLVDPAGAEIYAQNADRYITELRALDSLIRSELGECAKTDFIAFHDAFGYFAKRYGLTQHSVQGPSPEGEVLPQRISEIKDLASRLDIDVIYSEELVDPRLASVIAEELPNGRVLMLSPIEGLEEDELEQGLGYIDKMKHNLENLKVGLDCQA